MSSNLILIAGGHHEDALLLAEREARAQRIDALSVDRSGMATVPLRPWSPEAADAEERLEALRAETTMAEKVEAWRILFAMPRPAEVAGKHESPRT